MEALSCYLFIHLNHIPFIRTSLSLIFYFIIQILFLYPDRHGRSSYSSGIWIFPRLQASFWVLILNSDLLHEIQFPCCVLTCFLLNSRSLPLLIGYPDSKNVLYMRSSVDSPLMMCQASVPFTISSGISGTLNRNIFPSSSDIKEENPKREKHGEKTPNIKSTSAARFLDFYKKHPLPDPSLSPLSLIFRLYKQQFLDVSVSHGLIQPSAISLAGDGSPIRTSARLRYKKVCSCSEMVFPTVTANVSFPQPDCNIGWDSSRDCYFSGYHLYMFVASDSANDLPVFPILERASRHDMLSFLHTFFTMKTWLPQYRVTKLLLDAAHDADAVYRYCQESGIQPFIDLNSGNTGNFIYKDTFTINNNGVPVCKLGLHMKPDGVERNRNRCKWRCPKTDRSGCHCETPCSDSSYGRVVHTPVKDNPRLFNIPPRNSLEWDKEYDRRTSVERSNKREKEDYKLEDGRHRSSMMWYCRLYCTMMLQHLDAWEMPSIVAFQSLLSLDA